jgi:hypothetical protein
MENLDITTIKLIQSLDEELKQILIADLINIRSQQAA